MNISSHYASLPTFVYLIYGRPSCIKVHSKLQISDTYSISISQPHSNVQMVTWKLQSDGNFSDWQNARKLISWKWIGHLLSFGKRFTFLGPLSAKLSTINDFLMKTPKIQPWQKRFIPLLHKPYWNMVPLS